MPTKSAGVRVVNGDSGAYAEMIGWTLLRTVAVAPGLAVAGVRGRQLFWGSVLGSVGISVFAVTLAAFETRDDRRVTRTRRMKAQREEERARRSPSDDRWQY